MKKGINNKTEPKATKITRNKREHKINQDLMQIINCHCCKSVDSINNMVTCSIDKCKESFCINCIKKTYVKFNSNFFFIIKEHELNKKWKCYKCKGRCPCSGCKAELELKESNQMTRKKRTRKSKSVNASRSNLIKRGKIGKKVENAASAKTNIQQGKVTLKSKKRLSSTVDKTNPALDNPPIDETKIKEKLKVDDFLIYEYEQDCADNVEELNCEIKEEKIIEACAENDDIIPDSSYHDSVFSKICEMEDYEDPINNISITDNQPVLIASPLEKESLASLTSLSLNNKIFNSEKINDSKLVESNISKEINEKEEDFIIGEGVLDTSKNLHNDRNFSGDNVNINACFLNNNLNKASLNINFHTYKSQIKINNYFIKHKSFQSENQIEEQSELHDNKKKFLTKPCLVCQKARFTKNELLKLLTFEEFMLSFKYFIKQAEMKVQQNTFEQKYLETFYNNKKIFEEYFDKNFKSDPNLLKKNFRRGKRICVNCFQNNVEIKPLGANELFELVTEEDEQVEMDQTKKNEIFSEIKKFMYMNGYDVDKSFPIFSNSVDLTEQNFNIFNLIFSKHQQEDSTWHKYNSNFNSYSPMKTITNFNSNRSKMSEYLNLNTNTFPYFSNFNDKPKIQSGTPSIIDKNKNYLMNDRGCDRSLLDSDKRGQSLITEDKQMTLIELLKNQCQYIKNTMDFEQLIVVQTIRCVEDYIMHLSMISNGIHISIANLTDSICKIAAKKEEMNNFDVNAFSAKNDNSKETFVNDINHEGVNANYLRKNLYANAINANISGCIPYSLSDEQSILDYLNKLLYLDLKVFQSINMLKTIMNYFTMYLPIFTKINYELFTNFAPEMVPQKLNVKECDLQGASKTDKTENIKDITIENIDYDNSEKFKSDPLTFPLRPIFHSTNEEVTLKDK